MEMKFKLMIACSLLAIGLGVSIAAAASIVVPGSGAAVTVPIAEWRNVRIAYTASSQGNPIYLALVNDTGGWYGLASLYPENNCCGMSWWGAPPMGAVIVPQNPDALAGFPVQAIWMRNFRGVDVLLEGQPLVLPTPTPSGLLDDARLLEGADLPAQVVGVLNNNFVAGGVLAGLTLTFAKLIVLAIRSV
jgi:hypothetical protein